MKYNLNLLLGVGGCAIGLIGIGFAAGSRKKLNDVCSKINKSVDEVSNDIKVDISQDIVERAVDKAVVREVEWSVKRAVNDSIRSIKTDIHNQVSSAVNAQYSDIKKAVSDEVALKVSNINMKDLSDAVMAKAEARIIEKFDSNLDDLLAKFNHNLENVSKIYSSMANTMQKNNKEVTFSL